MTTPEPRRGEVWLAELDKLRPVVVLTRDPLGRYLHSVIVGPVTSRIRGITTEVPVGEAEGLRIASVVNLDHAQLLERARLRRRVGRAGPAVMHQICAALGISVDCTPG